MSLPDTHNIQQTDNTTEDEIVRPKHPVRLWRNRDFLLLISGQGVSSMGSQVSLVAFPLLILALTQSPAQAGFITALRGLPYALFCLPAGALVDRWNRKLLMILCDAGRAIALGSIPLALAFGMLTFVQLALVSLIEGTLFVFFNLAESSALPHVVTRKQLPDAIAQNEVLYSLSTMIGPGLAPIMYGIGRTIPFLVDAISYLASVVSLFFIKTKFQEERAASSRSLVADIGEGLTWLWHNPLIRFIAILTFGLTTPCQGYVLIYLVLAQHMHASNFVVGLIFAAGGVGSIIGAILVAPLNRRFRFGPMMISSTWVWALTWLLLAVALNPLMLGVFSTAAFIILPIYTLTQYSYRIAIVPDQLQGRVNSVFRLIAFSGGPLGIALTGLLLQFFGPVPTVLILFIPQGILAVVATFNRHILHAVPISEIG